jgi:hypothetical protein
LSIRVGAAARSSLSISIICWIDKVGNFMPHLAEQSSPGLKGLNRHMSSAEICKSI